MSKKVRVLHHDNCFDGVDSSAVFSSFYRLAVDADAMFEFEGVSHGPGAYLLEDKLGDGVNAILDFKYSSSGKAQSKWVLGTIDNLGGFMADVEGLVTGLDDPEDLQKKEFLASLGKQIDTGKDIGIEVEFMNPLTSMMEQLSHNILESN